MIIFLGIISIAILVGFIIDFKNHRMTTKQMVMASLISAISFVLSLIQFIRYPQGGGIALLSMLPVMLFALIYGRTAGVAAGLVFGLLSLLDKPYVIHPVQLLLDYIFPTMALGMAGVFGSNTRIKRICGPVVAVALNVLSKVLSGVIFFGSYAPEGMAPLVYSLGYNLSTAGVEGLLCIVVIAILPFDKIKKHALA